MELLVTDIANDPKLFATESGDSKRAYQIGGGFDIPIDYRTSPIFTIQSSPWSAYKPSGQSSVYYQNTFTAKTQDFFDKSAAEGVIYNTVDYKFSGWNLNYETWDSENNYYITSYVPIGSNTSLSTIANYSVDHYNGGPSSAEKGYEVNAGYTWCWSSRMTISGEGKIQYQQNYYNGVNNFCGITAIPSAGWKFDHYERRKYNVTSSYTAYDYSAYSMNTNLDEVYTVYFAEDNPYNPLSLPAYTIRVKYKDNSTEPTDKIVRSGCVLNQVSQIPNVWDVTVNDGNIGKENWDLLFRAHYDLIEVVGANAKGVTSMKDTFVGCSALSSLNLFDTRDVVYANDMFGQTGGRYCESLTSVPEFSFDNAVVLSYMFYGCSALTGVKLKNTNNVTSCYYTFTNCYSLQSVDMNTSALEDVNRMFSGCSSLSAIPDLGFTAVTKCPRMFENCYNIESGISALYGQFSARITSTANYTRCFRNCGQDTVQGAAELAQIPDGWK